MNKIPIGNTLQVRWRVKHNGQAESLEGLDLSLVMTHPDGQKQAMAFAVSDTNLVTVNYEGKDQNHLGNYRLDLFENRGENNQRRIDSTPAFVLVAHTSEANRESDPNLEVYTVDLTGDIEIDYPSTAVLFTPQELTDEQKAQARENIGVDAYTKAEADALLADKQDTLDNYSEEEEGGEKVVTIDAKTANGTTNIKGYYTNIVAKELKLNIADTAKLNGSKIATATDLAGKVDKVAGKGLSTNDYTDADKSALAGKLDRNFSPFSGIDISHYSDYDDASFNIERKKNNVKTANISFGSLGVWVTHADGTHGLIATKNQVNSKQDKLIAGTNITIAADGKTISSPSELFFAEYNVTSFEDIAAAYNAGKFVFVKGDGGKDILPLVRIRQLSPKSATFTRLESEKKATYILCKVEDTTTQWSGKEETLATSTELSGKQDTISDLSDIREGASAGATALQPTDLAAWAKQPTKPTYTASEVGALPSTTEIPSKTSDLTNDSGYTTQAYVDGLVGNILTVLTSI